MINLIPPEGHKAVKREYLFRAGSTFCFLFGWVGLLIAAALIPTYVLISAQIGTFELEAEREQSKDDAVKKAQEEVGTAEAILMQLKTTTETFFSSTAIDEIQKRAPRSIAFRTFSIEESQGRIEKVQIQGVAPTREALAELKTAIESSDLFLKAEVPIADLARDVDLPFAITVTIERTQ